MIRSGPTGIFDSDGVPGPEFNRRLTKIARNGPVAAEKSHLKKKIAPEPRF
jgi:hypothetical protein